jgi:hypothetical protein
MCSLLFVISLYEKSAQYNWESAVYSVLYVLYSTELLAMYL